MRRGFLLVAAMFLAGGLVYPTFVRAQGKAPEVIRVTKKSPAGATSEPVMKGVPAPEAQPPTEAAPTDPSFQQGRKYLEAGDYARAAKAFQQSLTANPNSAETYYHLGLAYDAQGDQDKAAKNLKAAMRLQPNFPQARVALGQIYNQKGLSLLQQGNLAQAESTLREAVTQDPKNDRAFNNLGVTLGKQGSYTESLAALERAVALNPNNSSAQFNLGVLQYTLGDKDATVQQYTILTLRDPDAADELFRIIQGTSQVAKPFRY